MEKDKTLILGASTNPSRFSNKAALKLKANGFSIVMIGKSQGEVVGEKIDREKVKREDVDTITLYLNPTHQQAYYDYIISLKPNRVIFNPGTENRELRKMLQDQKIEVLEACTLVMLASGQY